MIEAAAVLKRKRGYITIVRTASVLSALMFPIALLAFLDPPNSKLPLAPAVMKALYTLCAMCLLWWTLRRNLPLLRKAQTVSSLFLRGLCCVYGTFFCSLCGVFTFIADSPRLGSPLIVLPYVLAAVAVDWKYILPQMAAYQPTQADLSGVEIVR